MTVVLVEALLRPSWHQNKNRYLRNNQNLGQTLGTFWADVGQMLWLVLRKKRTLQCSAFGGGIVILLECSMTAVKEKPKSPSPEWVLNNVQAKFAAKLNQVCLI